MQYFLAVPLDVSLRQKTEPNPRWKLCVECLQQRCKEKTWKRTWILGGLDVAREREANGEQDWKNPYRTASGIGSKNTICDVCRYQVEHLVLSKENCIESTAEMLS